MDTSIVYRVDFRDIRRGRVVRIDPDGAEVIQPIYLTSDGHNGPEERWEPGNWHATKKAAWTASAEHHEADVDRGIEEDWDAADQLYAQCALAYARRALAWFDVQEKSTHPLLRSRHMEGEPTPEYNRDYYSLVYPCGCRQVWGSYAGFGLRNYRGVEVCNACTETCERCGRGVWPHADCCCDDDIIAEDQGASSQ